MTSDISGSAVGPHGWPATVPPPLFRAAPALAALAYPALVWSGPAVWPPLLATALLAPAVAVWAYVRSHDGAPVARAVALAAVAAPPAFTLLGALLDFQHRIPLSGITVWIPLWLGLAAVAWRAPALPAPVAVASAAPRSLRPARPERRAPRPLAVVHGISALPIIAFALAHVINHASGVVGGAAHLAIMAALRTVYRHPYIEPVLFACIAAQVVTGILLVVRRSPRVLDGIDRVQRAAGVYLAVFFASHLTATLRARYLRGIDTDWHWLSAYKLTDAWCARLGPYYALSVVALAVHLACAVRSVAIGRGLHPRSWTWLFATTVGLAVLAATLSLIGIQRG